MRRDSSERDRNKRVNLRLPDAESVVGARHTSVWTCRRAHRAPALQHPHSVIAAPYHRKSAGNHRVIEMLLASPDAAEKRVRASGAEYVMLYPSMHAVQGLKARAPRGLAAMPADGKHPDWLEPVPLNDTPYRVFTLRPPLSGSYTE